MPKWRPDTGGVVRRPPPQHFPNTCAHVLTHNSSNRSFGRLLKRIGNIVVASSGASTASTPMVGALRLPPAPSASGDLSAVAFNEQNLLAGLGSMTSPGQLSGNWFSSQAMPGLFPPLGEVSLGTELGPGFDLQSLAGPE